MKRNRLFGFLAVTVAVLMSMSAWAQSVPAGKALTVRLNESLSSGSAQVGQAFEAALADDLVVNGRTIARAGTPVRGKVTYVKSSGRLHVPGELSLRLTSIEINGRSETLRTAALHFKGKSHTKSNVTKIGGGAAAGAIIGAIAGGGKGAAIGAAAGTAAGTGVAAATGKQEAEVHAEQALTFTTVAATASTRR